MILFVCCSRCFLFGERRGRVRGRNGEFDLTTLSAWSWPWVRKTALVVASSGVRYQKEVVAYLHLI